MEIGSRSPHAGMRSLSRRGSCRPFAPIRCSFPIIGLARESANILTHRTLDPRSKIPEFKVSACRIRKADGPPAWATAEDTADHTARSGKVMYGYEFYVDPSRCIGCQSCVKACEECETHRGHSMINFDFIDRHGTIATAAYVCWHCEEPTCAQVCPADAIKKGEDGIVHVGTEAALYRLLELRSCVSVRHSEDFSGVRADDEMRHVLRPDVGRQKADVRHGLPQPGAVLRAPGRNRQAAREAVERFSIREPDDYDAGLHDGSRRDRCRVARHTGLHVGGVVCLLFRSPNEEPLWRDEFSISQATSATSPAGSSRSSSRWRVSGCSSATSGFC